MVKATEFFLSLRDACDHVPQNVAVADGTVDENEAEASDDADAPIDNLLHGAWVQACRLC